MSAARPCVHFRKYQALGNDYIVIDMSEFPFDPRPEYVRIICDRKYGIGSDGILLGSDFGAAAHSENKAAPRVRIFNPDGSEAEKSGNGLRIFSYYLAERGAVPHAGAQYFSVVTASGRTRSRIINFDAGIVEVDMGKASFSTSDYGLICDNEEYIGQPLRIGGKTFTATFVSMGNPHCVLLVEKPTREMALRYGPLIEVHPMFPRKTNVQFMTRVDRKNIRIEIWERGAGYTLASGSSSCAAASAAKKMGLVDKALRVHMPGGALDIQVADAALLMTGPVEKVMEGFFSQAMLSKIGHREGAAAQ